jgi:HEAT repeat protein
MERINVGNWRQVRTILFMLACATRVAGTPVHTVDVAGLAAGANLIVVGQVESITATGRGTLDYFGTQVGVTQLTITLRADRILKGLSTGQPLAFASLLPDSPIPYRGIPLGQYGIFFLKGQHSNLDVFDPVYPFLPALHNAQIGSGDALNQVTTMLGQVLTSSTPSERDRFDALEALTWLKTPAAGDVLRAAMKQSFGAQRLLIAARLVARNDFVGLEPVATALLHPKGLPHDLLLNLAGSIGGMKDPQAVPTLARLVKANNPDINQYAAAALRQSGSHAALEPLSHLFDDPDLKTRYYAVIGFGEITHQNDWAPAFDEFQQHEEHYLSYWRVWAQTNLR